MNSNSRKRSIEFLSLPAVRQAGNLGVLLLSLFFFACTQHPVSTEPARLWHNQQRELRYHPDGHDFVITNGTHRFNRALYGGNSGFRVEAGDLPEFALYMPRMGGTLRLGLICGDSSKWLINAANIEARYNAGKMSYTVTDPILKKGVLHLEVLALYNADGMILRIEQEKIPDDVKLFWAFGGATGKRFSRDGDLGADPESSFYLKPEYCTDNEYFITNNSFNLYYGSGRSFSENELYENNYQPTSEEMETTRLKTKKRIFGLVPETSTLHTGDATEQKNPNKFYGSNPENAPAITGVVNINQKEEYLLLLNPDTKEKPAYSQLPTLFLEADSTRRQLATRIVINTPDEYLNAAGAQLATAADAVWDGQSFVHGAIAWRMPLNGWRGAYAADWLGWHDRAEKHFHGYFASQYTEPASGPSVPDPKTHLARQTEKVGTALFTSGYISRNPGKINKPHHYDMNLVFIDQLLWHFRWTGDLEFLRESWPVLERHLAWEKRNFDANNDGLYDAYCCIWASDALQYRGGGVTHSSAYNYHANLMAAELAPLIGKDPAPYRAEAEKIKKAVNKQLWLPQNGWFAEYKDLLGNQLVHPSAALWTVYHVIDEGLADPFQAYQTTQYVDRYIPHIPVEGKGIPAGEYYTLSTTNWMPYTWSINNVAMAEVLHTALAYWQAGRSSEALTLMKSTFLDYMFMGTSPGNFGQLSFYDAFRGELYRDFADPIGVASRDFIEGLFGVQPDVVNKTLTICPGWPPDWPFAELKTPDVKINFKKEGKTDHYQIEPYFSEKLKLRLVVKAKTDKIESVSINGEVAQWKRVDTAIEFPEIELLTAIGNRFDIKIEWNGKPLERPSIQPYYTMSDNFAFKMGNATIADIYDPQQVFRVIETKPKEFSAELNQNPGQKTAFVKLHQGEITWWQPLYFEERNLLDVICPGENTSDQLHFSIRNNTPEIMEGTIFVNNFHENVSLTARSSFYSVSVPDSNLVPGSNIVEIQSKEHVFAEKITKWNVQSKTNVQYEPINLGDQFNDRITNIFKEQYYSPRSPYPTLSIPVQGIGDWCSYREIEEIDDSGLRKLAGKENRVVSPQGIPFDTPSEEIPNILFTSQWDNYPSSATVSLSGQASHLYLLMAGSSPHMQSRMINGVITVEYIDGTKETLPLANPDNWWPIEQNYYTDSFAFQTDAPQPPRLYLKTGEWHLDSYNVWAKNRTIKIAGGAASLLDMPLDPVKELKSLTLETSTNDVVIGLMAATLVR